MDSMIFFYGKLQAKARSCKISTSSYTHRISPETCHLAWTSSTIKKDGETLESHHR